MGPQPIAAGVPGAAISLVLAEAPQADSEFILSVAANGDAARSLLLGQKVKLVEGYLKSASVSRIEGGGDVNAKDLVRRARTLLGSARTALETGGLDQAERDMDEALQALLTASSQAGVRDSAQSAVRFERLRRSIEGFLESLRRAPDDNAVDLASAVDRVERLMADAERLSASGHYGEANGRLAEAYRSAVLAVSEQWQGRTVVARLRFEAPEDELEYEQRRNESYEMMVELMMSERQAATGALVDLVERYVSDSRGLRRGAVEEAATGDYAAAIRTMEDATRQLVRALQAGGLPVSE